MWFHPDLLCHLSVKHLPPNWESEPGQIPTAAKTAKSSVLSGADDLIPGLNGDRCKLVKDIGHLSSAARFCSAFWALTELLLNGRTSCYGSSQT